MNRKRYPIINLSYQDWPQILELCTRAALGLSESVTIEQLAALSKLQDELDDESPRIA